MPSLVVAVMVAVPGDLAVTMPSLLTVAIDVLLDLQVTVLLVALVGRMVAVSCKVFPLFNSALVSFREIEVARTTCGLTVTAQEAVRLVPSFVLAVIVAEPGAIAVTLPLLLTVAMLLLLVDQVTVLLVALVGSTVAVNCKVFPSVISALALFS